MRIPINLSSEPFRKDRPILVASSVCALLLIGLLAMLVVLIVGERERAKEARVAVTRLNAQVRTVAAEANKIRRVPASAGECGSARTQPVAESVAQRKSISWTKIFADLESVLPPTVKLISVRLPQINSQNEVLLDMVVGAKEPEPVIGFFKKLEESPLFGPLQGHSSLPPSQNEPLYRYRVTVNYAQKL